MPDKDHQPARHEDRRQARTRRLLADALHSLMRERRYNTITIQDIIDRADVGRSTFYAHFRDKDDLALQSVQQLFDAQMMVIEADSADGRLMPVKEAFQHVKDESRLFRNLVRGEALELIFEGSQVHWAERLTVRLQRMQPAGTTAAVPLPLVAAHIAGTMTNLMRWWLDNGMPYTPEEMDEYFHRLVGSISLVSE